MEKLPYLAYSKEEVSTLINQLCPAQFQEIARAVWALSNPKEALLTYAKRLEFRDGCRGKFRKALANTLIDISAYVDKLYALGYRLLTTCDIGLSTMDSDDFGYDSKELRRIAVHLIGPDGNIEETAFDELGGPFEVDISECLDMSNEEKLNWMEMWQDTVHDKLQEVINSSQS